jgi:uncharacterized damage-inducible protein DinB
MLRDLDALVRELEAFPDEAAVWAHPPGAPNSAGTLALHVAGNLRHFIGATLGDTGYQRDRPTEFAARDLPRSELVAPLRTARDEVDATLRGLDPAALAEPFPAPFGTTHLTVGQALIHLATHLSYHLGQVDYCRRITTGDGTGVQAMGFEGLETV